MAFFIPFKPVGGLNIQQTRPQISTIYTPAYSRARTTSEKVQNGDVEQSSTAKKTAKTYSVKKK